MSQPSLSPARHFENQIKSCYQLHPGAAVYYETLVRHISNRKEDPNIVRDSLKAYEVVPNGDGQAQQPEVSTGPYITVDPYSDPQNGRLYVIEGHVRPEAINFLGSRLSVRPELFIGHLGLCNEDEGRPRYYERPALPSRRVSIVHIQMVTIGGMPADDKREMDMEKARQDATLACNDYNRKFMSRDIYYGATRFRSVNRHDRNTFTVEQLISFALVKEETRWTGVFLLDKGTDNGDRLQYEDKLPWAQHSQGEMPPRMVPIIPYGSYGDSLTQNDSIPLKSLQPAAMLSSYHPINNLALEDKENTFMLRDSPFYILSQVLLEAALSWNQVLNLLERDVEVSQSAAKDDSKASLHQLRFDIGYIDHVRRYLDQNYDVLQNQYCSEWPRFSNESPEKSQDRVESFRRSLLSDYEYLQRRCEAVARRAERASNTIIRDIQHHESSKSIHQAEKVSSLTNLAYLFLPWSLAASIFGMNVSQFVPGARLSVLAFVATSACLLCVALSAAYRVEIFRWLRMFSSRVQWRALGIRLPRP